MTCPTDHFALATPPLVLPDSESFEPGVLDLIQGRLSAMHARLYENVIDPGSVCLTRDTLIALLLYERNELDAAHNLLTRVLPNVRQACTADTLIIAHLLMARLALQRGERQSWLRYLLQLERIGQQCGSWRIQCSAWLEQARVETLNNRLDMARQALHTADQFSDWDRPGIVLYANDVDNPLICRLRLRIAECHYEGAIEELLASIAHARTCQHRRRELKLLLLLAMAHDGNKHPQFAMQALDQAFRLASAEGWRQSFIEEGERLAALLRRWASLRQGQADGNVELNFNAELLRRINSNVGDTDSAPALTAREIKVLQLLAVGHRNRVIAEKMFLSECTVKSHLYRINRKLGAQDRNQALAIARRRGWLD